MAIDTKSNEDRVVLLAASNSYTSNRLSDQNVFKFGTNRVSEIKGVITDSKEPYNDYLDSL